MSDTGEQENTPTYPIVLVECTPDESDGYVGQLTMLGAEGIEERDATTLIKGGPKGVTLSASFASFTEAEAAVEAIGRDAARIETLVGDAWRDGWKEHWKPTRLGERVVIVPSWVEYAPEARDLVLKLDPGRAFGTGQHASTALACAAIERFIAARSPSHMLDVGCGSGILCFAALLLGMPRASGCDTDPESVEVANENAGSLGLQDRVDFNTGSSELFRAPGPLVVANIETHVLVPMAASLSSLVIPGGGLVLSGVLATQREEINEAYTKAGFTAGRCDERDGWVAPEFTRRA